MQAVLIALDTRSVELLLFVNMEDNAHIARNVEALLVVNMVDTATVAKKFFAAGATGRCLKLQYRCYKAVVRYSIIFFFCTAL